MNNNQYQKIDVDAIKRNGQYRQVRMGLLAVIIFSALNVFLACFAGAYFLFSSYITQIIAVVGAEFYAETQDITYLVIFAVIGIISVVPYLLFFIFSKKHVGCMIAALVLFSVDSLIFLIDFVNILAAGQFTIITDIVIRAYVLFTLAMGVKYGLAAKKAAANEVGVTAVPVAPVAPTAEAGQEGQGEEHNPDAPEAEQNKFEAMSRELTVARKKSFVGSAIAFSCYLDGKLVCSLKNGQTQTITANGYEHELVIMGANGNLACSVMVPVGPDSKSYFVEVKSGFATSSLQITERIVWQKE